jgi:hypothetical protein
MEDHRLRKLVDGFMKENPDACCAMAGNFGGVTKTGPNAVEALKDLILIREAILAFPEKFDEHIIKVPHLENDTSRTLWSVIGEDGVDCGYLMQRSGEVESIGIHGIKLGLIMLVIKQIRDLFEIDDAQDDLRTILIENGLSFEVLDEEMDKAQAVVDNVSAKETESYAEPVNKGARPKWCRRVIKAFNRKSYAPKAGYSHLDALDEIHGHAAFLGDMEAGGEGIPEIERQVIKQFAKNDLPTYLVESDVHIAMQLTNVPHDIEESDLRLPLSSFLIVVPDEYLIEADGHKFTSILVCEPEPGNYDDTMETVLGETGVGHVITIEDRVIYWMGLQIDREEGEISGTTIASGSFNVDHKGLTELKKTFSKAGVRMSDADSEESTSEVDMIRGSTQVAAYLIKLLIFMHYLPNQVKDQERTVIHRQGVGSAERVAWNPRVIGKKYKLPTISPENNGGDESVRRGPRMHWRRGHFRRVAVGENRVDRKRVWIEPTIVNPPTKDSPSAEDN